MKLWSFLHVRINLHIRPKTVTAVGFEPTHPKIVELESTALDHSAKLSMQAFTELLWNEVSSSASDFLDDTRDVHLTSAHAHRHRQAFRQADRYTYIYTTAKATIFFLFLEKKNKKKRKGPVLTVFFFRNDHPPPRHLRVSDVLTWTRTQVEWVPRDPCQLDHACQPL